MSRSLFLIVFLCLSLPAELLASGTVVRGVVIGREGRELYMLSYLDHLSGRWIVEKQVTIGEDGSFSIQADIPHTELVTLVSGGWEADLYLRPKDEVEIELRVPQESVAVRFNTNRFHVLIKEASDDNPNLLLSDFNSRSLEMLGESTYDLARYFGAGSSGFRSMRKEELLKANMVTQSGDSLTIADKTALIDSVNTRFMRLQHAVNSQIESLTDTVTQQLLKASLGKLDLSLGRSREEVYRDYLPSDGCDWWNPAAVRLYEEFHKLLRQHPEVEASLLLTAVKAGDLAKARDALVDYPFYDRPKGRDALILFIAQQLWYEDRVYRNGAIRIIERLQAEKAIGDMANQLRRELEEGTPLSDAFLPDITLLDHRSERINLDGFDDQFVYLSVVTLSSTVSQRELLLMENLHRKYGRQVRFVTLVMDEDPDAMRNHLAAHPDQEWMFLQGGHDPRLQRSLNLLSVPSFFLVRPDNRLQKPYTPSPSEGVEQMLSKAAGGDTREFNPWLDRQ